MDTEFATEQQEALKAKQPHRPNQELLSAHRKMEIATVEIRRRSRPELLLERITRSIPQPLRFLRTALTRLLGPFTVNLTSLRDLLADGFNASSTAQLAAESRLEVALRASREHDQQVRSLEESLERLSQQIAVLSRNSGQSLHSTEERHYLDSFYAAFENRHRGSEELIRERQQVYIDFWMRLSPELRTDKLSIDLGCGRGEWLQLLQQNGARPAGCDLNPAAIQRCESKGLNVDRSDFFRYLRKVGEDSASLVTGFHIIEHIDPESLVLLAREVYRVLSPGGMVAFETPNPENVNVATNSFYGDPTHLRPVPKILVSFALEFAGFSEIEIIDLHPFPPDFHVEGGPAAEKINMHFYGAQDYGIIARKP